MSDYQLIVRPIISEKSVDAAEQGKYLFAVSGRANKVSIRQAIESLYGVNVVKVNISKIQPKIRLVGRGRQITKRSEEKKAVVTLKKGQSIDINKISKKK